MSENDSNFNQYTAKIKKMDYCKIDYIRMFGCSQADLIQFLKRSLLKYSGNLKQTLELKDGFVSYDREVETVIKTLESKIHPCYEDGYDEVSKLFLTSYPHKKMLYIDIKGRESFDTHLTIKTIDEMTVEDQVEVYVGWRISMEVYRNGFYVILLIEVYSEIEFGFYTTEQLDINYFLVTKSVFSRADMKTISKNLGFLSK